MKKTLSNSIAIACWNIDGLHYKLDNTSTRYSKLKDESILKSLQNHDIICLVETHCNYTDAIDLDGYSTVMNIRPKSHKATKHSGGIAICIKNTIRPGLTFEPITNSEYLWFKLDKKFFNISDDIYVACIYICPYGSSYSSKTDDIFDLLESDIGRFSKKGTCLLCGDFNSRTATEPDFCKSDNLDEVLDLPYSYVQDIDIMRHNCDSSKPDKNGHQLLNLCKGTGVRIVNGRCLGDSSGYFTCFSSNGAPSVIDYMLITPSLFDSIDFFHVMDPHHRSIHCCMSITLKTSPYTTTHVCTDNNLQCLKQYKWQEGDDEKFICAMYSTSIRNKLDSIAVSNPNSDSNCINAEVNKLIDIFSETADTAGIRKKSNIKRKTIKRKQFKWYNSDCANLRRNLNMQIRHIRTDPFNTEKLNSFRKLRKLYKNTLRKTKRKYEKQVLDNLENLKSRNPQAFWKTFNDLKTLESEHKVNPIPAEDWVSHFTLLMNKSLSINKDKDQQFDNYISENINTVFNELNFKITDIEIIKAIQNLNINKASGVDGILNEMLKATITIITPHLNRVFNQILSYGKFPDVWRVNTLTPLHKKGSILQTENYRGIAVGSNLSKLFCSVLHRRLIEFADSHNLIPLNQIGYKKKTRTVDHILTLKHIIDKHIFKLPRKYLFVCFVDFKSAFDTVWRKALMYKLLTYGVAGNFLSVLRSIYEDVSYCVKLNGRLTPNITSNVGVKQGCVLSPTLFNLFLVDLPEIFDEHCDPVDNFDAKLNCLMFADDIVLISQTAEGLQNCINRLHTYTNKWQLMLNTKKTKVVIFNKGGHI